MSNMKDYMMWLDDRSIAKWDAVIGELIIPEGTNVYSPELVNEYQNDDAWHNPSNNENEEDEWPLDGVDMGDSCEWTPTEHWIDANGGLTADAHQLLYEQDSEGDLV
tara:strand:+ start:788 stop:1108 length:321 start_codon:yes stop_codon:yes gene_type:complete